MKEQITDLEHSSKIQSLIKTIKHNFTWLRLLPKSALGREWDNIPSVTRQQKYPTLFYGNVNSVPMNCHYSRVHAFTLVDILEVLPKILNIKWEECHLNIRFHEDRISIAYVNHDTNTAGGNALAAKQGTNFANTAAEMLLWCDDNGHLQRP